MKTNILRVALALLLLLQPVFAASAGAAPTPASIVVEDVVAGFETTVRVTGLAGGMSVDVHVASPSGEDTALPMTADATGAGEVSIPARLTEEAGTYRVFAMRDAEKLTNDAMFEVLSDRMDAALSTVTSDRPTIAADGRATATITVRLNDRHGNPLAGRPVQLFASRTQDLVTPMRASRETDGAGSMQFLVQTSTPGEMMLRALDMLSGTPITQAATLTALSGAMGGFAEQVPSTGAWNAQLIPSAAAAPVYDVIAKFVVKPSVQSLKARDVLPNLEILAVDSQGRTVESFVGTVRITTPDDPNSTLPGLPPDQGKATFSAKARGDLNIPWSVAFSKSGTQRILVTDESGTIRGEASVTVAGAGAIPADRKIVLESPTNGETVNSREILVKGKKAPSLANLNVFIVDASTPEDQITAGEPAARGESESNGAFAFAATIPDDMESVIVDVQSDDARYDSGPVRVSLDTKGPSVKLNFDPAQPTAGDTVTLTAVSEPGLPEVTFAIAGRTLTLTESQPGSYTVSFEAPARDQQNYTLSARDVAGNVTDMDGQLGVSGQPIPQVQNVKARSLAGGIELTWDMIPDDTLGAYRIEVKSPALSEPIVLDTPEPTDAAAVMGLKAGNDYALTVRAVRDDEKGPPSSPIMARTLGIEMTVTPQENGLLVQWTFPDSTPLSSFVFEYGSPEGEYSEKRTLDGAMRAYTMNDLLNQPYLIRLTPIATTGETLTDLTVTAEGTPLTATAFRPSGDDVRVNPDSHAPDNGLHSGAPTTTGSGSPLLSWKLVLALTAIAGGAYFYKRRKGMREARMFMDAMRTRYHS